MLADDVANPYAGLDRFGRVIDCLWQNYGTSVDAARVEYGYDRASNRIWREDTISPSGENDELYGYDRLQRLVSSARGALSVDKSYVDDLQFAQDWTLDATGNWNRLVQTDSNDPAENLDQSRKQNAANEITAIIRRYGAEWPSPEFDRAGNMTVFPQPATPMSSYSATYDAWNRLVTLSGGNSYAYDPLNRRTIQVTGGVTRHYFYSTQWQVLEERLGTSPDMADAERQFVWGLRYIDDLVLRDRSPTNNGTLSERLYSLQDANWNVVAITDDDGAVEERYRYTAYGTPSFLEPDFAPQSPDESEVEWETLYCGYQWDEAIGLYQVRWRYLNPIVGSWLTRDPVGLSNGDVNLFNYVTNNPIRFTDPNGLEIPGPGYDPYGTSPDQAEIDQQNAKLDATEDANLATELKKCCSCETTNESAEECKKELDYIIAGLARARTALYKAGGPSILSFNGPVCTECQSEVLHKIGSINKYFEYNTVTFRSGKLWGDHAWGEIKCKRSGTYVTIDFWKGGRNYWRTGQDPFGYTRGGPPSIFDNPVWAFP